jgi:hypothetical protein
MEKTVFVSTLMPSHPDINDTKYCDSAISLDFFETLTRQGKQQDLLQPVAQSSYAISVKKL